MKKYFYQPITYYSYLGWSWLLIFGLLSITLIIESGEFAPVSKGAILFYIFVIAVAYIIHQTRLKITEKSIILKRPFLFKEEIFDLDSTKISKIRFGVILQRKNNEKLRLMMFPFQAKKILAEHDAQ